MPDSSTRNCGSAVFGTLPFSCREILIIYGIRIRLKRPIHPTGVSDDSVLQPAAAAVVRATLFLRTADRMKVELARKENANPEEKTEETTGEKAEEKTEERAAE